MPLTLWESFTTTIRGDSNYQLTALRVKSYGGCKLTTTPFTIVNEVAEHFPDPNNSLASFLDVKELHVESIEVAEDFRRWHCYRRCNKTLTDVSSLQVATCAYFKAVQRVSTYRKTYSVKIGITEPKGGENLQSLTLFSTELEVILDRHNLANPERLIAVDSEPDSIYLALLMVDPCTLRYKKSNNLVTQVRF